MDASTSSPEARYVFSSATTRTSEPGNCSENTAPVCSTTPRSETKHSGIPGRAHRSHQPLAVLGVHRPTHPIWTDWSSYGLLRGRPDRKSDDVRDHPRRG